ncbi:MAG: TorF family putative porin [Solimonas sp.]
MEFKRSVLGAVLIGAAVFSGSAFADVTGNVGVVSDYIYRGLPQAATSGESAVQGGLDYTHASGFYAGFWSSSLAGGTNGGYELDGYLGFASTIGDFGYDIGALYYGYPKSGEGENEDVGTLEFHVKGSYGPVSLAYNYSDDWFNTGKSAQYVVGALTLPVSDSLSFGASVGYSFGDAFKGTDGASDTDYVDYSLSLTKSLTKEFSASFSVVGTDHGYDETDKTPRFLVGGKYTFSL